MNGPFIRIFTFFAVIVFFSGCATTPQHHAYSDTSALVIGKTTPAECRAIYGEPKETDVKTGATGRFEIYRYGDVAERWGKACVRILATEFKDGTLNGYAFASSFPEDHTGFSATNFTKIEWAVSTRDEVQQLLGKPNGRSLCPTMLFAENCKLTGREIWLYANIEPYPLLAPMNTRFTFPIEVSTIIFDQYGIAMDITKKQGMHF
jgi:hypothetical protein